MLLKISLFFLVIVNENFKYYFNISFFMIQLNHINLTLMLKSFLFHLQHLIQLIFETFHVIYYFEYFNLFVLFFYFFMLFLVVSISPMVY